MTGAFIGRDRDLVEVRALLDASRLVSVLGPGGMGKTRLVRAIAAEADAPVAALGGAASITEGLAAGLGVDAREVSAPETLRGRVIAQLRERETPLVVVDGLDGLVEDAAELNAYLDALPLLRLLVSSRERLRLSGERAFELQPLSEGDACALVRARASVELDDNEALSALIERTERIPLALELAAAQLRLLSPAQLCARLDEKLALLVSDRRDVEAKHRSLHAAVAGSVESLPADLKDAFVRCALLSSPFSLELAEAVLAPADALTVLARLSDASLVQTAPAGFSMYGAVRAYALHAPAPGLAEAVDALALAHHANAEADPEGAARTVLRQAARGPLSIEARFVVAWLARHFSRQGPAWRGAQLLDAAAAAGPPSAVLSIARARHVLVFGHRPLTTVREDLSAARACDATVVDTAEYLSTLGLLSRRAGATEKALEHYARAVRAATDEASRAANLGELAAVCFETGKIDEARALFEEARLLSPDGRLLTNLALVADAQGDHAAARAARLSALSAHRESGDRRFLGITLGDLGVRELLDGRARAAADHLDEALVCLREADDLAHVHLFSAAQDAACARTGGPAPARPTSEVTGAFAEASQIFHILASLTRALAADDDAARAEAERALEQRRGTPLAETSDEVRLALLVASALDGAGALVVESDARAYRLGGERVELASSPLLVRLLTALIGAHLTDGEAVARGALIAAGWPDEKIKAESANNRLFVAINKLKKRGLDIASEEGGYRLPPELTVIVAQPTTR